MFDIYVDKNPLYTCAECGAKVVIKGDNIKRSCDHTGMINANVAARVRGKGGILGKIEHEFKMSFSKGFTALLGRSVIWR